jgi:AraC-like DNA-binding protein
MMEFAFYQPISIASFSDAASARRGEPVLPRGEILRRRRFDMIRDYVDQNLSDPELAARGAARALGMSVRSLHLALAGSGESFGQLLQRRRLERCCMKLRGPSAAGSVADIAFDCGFNSLSSFYRAFRGLYGASPRGLRTDVDFSGMALAA